MGFKTPSTASCEWLSVLVKLPRETRENVELSVESEAIDVRSPRWGGHEPGIYRLDPRDRGRAKLARRRTSRSTPTGASASFFDNFTRP